MSFEWPIGRLSDYCTKIGSGATPKGGKEAYVDHGDFRLIRSQNVYNDGFSWAGIAYITPKQAKQLEGVAVQPSDVLVNITGDSVARVCTVPGDVLPARVNQHVAIVRPRSDDIDPEYLRWLLCSPQYQERLLALASAGATRNALTKAMLELLEVPIPPLCVQRELTAPLSAIERRITLLRETNATLEAITQAMFKSWFVDFDPVRAKMAGRAPEGMDEATAAMFPVEFEESALGLTPKGWRVSAIGESVEVVGGSTPDTKNQAFWAPGTHHWTSPKDLSGAKSPVLLDTERKVSDAGLEKISSGLLPVGTLLMSSRAPIGYLSLTKIPVAINQGYIAMLPGGNLPPLYLYFWCRSHMDAIKGRANGSTFMEISKKAFRPIPALQPPPSVVARFVDIAEAVFARLAENERQARSLEALRDTLLPRLISGRLRVPETAAAVPI